MTTKEPRLDASRRVLDVREYQLLHSQLDEEASCTRSTKDGRKLASLAGGLLRFCFRGSFAGLGLRRLRAYGMYFNSCWLCYFVLVYKFLATCVVDAGVRVCANKFSIH
jgi:hypothetical protein